MENVGRNFISRSAVAEIFGVTPQTVSNWFTDGILQGITIKGNRFATRESVEKLMEIYPDAAADANKLETYKKEVEALQDDLREQKNNLRRERIYRHYAPRYMENFVSKFIRLMAKVVGNNISIEPSLQEKFIHCWLFGHDISEMCKDNNISHYMYLSSVKHYLKGLKQMDNYAELVERNRILEEEVKQIKMENVRLRTDMEEYRSRFTAVNNVETWKEKYPVLTSSVIDLDLSVRTLNVLKMHGFETLAQVIQYNKPQLLKLRYFGKKSLMEIEDYLEQYGLEFGVDLDSLCNKNN